MECLDVLTDSPKWYHKKHVENSVENMHVDIGALRVKKKPLAGSAAGQYPSLPSPFPLPESLDPLLMIAA